MVVVLLNGQKLEVMCDPSTTGQQLFEAVVTQIELPEFYFFGLTYVTGKLEVMCDPSTIGQQLFEAVVTQIELPEFYFFGLTYVTGKLEQ